MNCIKFLNVKFSGLVESATLLMHKQDLMVRLKYNFEVVISINDILRYLQQVQCHIKYIVILLVKMSCKIYCDSISYIV